MQSKTFVNEVDIRKIKIGQKVDIGLDSDPSKKLKGTVTKVANVGEQRPNTDAKVFEVVVEIEGSDPTLRPSMTTSNKIVAQVLSDVVYVPLESLHLQHDSITYVFKKDGISIHKQEVMVGENNSNEVVILAGIEANDQVYLSMPKDREKDDVNLLPQLNGKRQKKNKPDEDVKSNQPKTANAIVK
jgi:hypothetical protein